MLDLIDGQQPLFLVHAVDHRLVNQLLHEVGGAARAVDGDRLLLLDFHLLPCHQGLVFTLVGIHLISFELEEMLSTGGVELYLCSGLFAGVDEQFMPPLTSCCFFSAVCVLH
jgi:hypothetical protein